MLVWYIPYTTELLNMWLLLSKYDYCSLKYGYCLFVKICTNGCSVLSNINYKLGYEFNKQKSDELIAKQVSGKQKKKEYPLLLDSNNNNLQPMQTEIWTRIA